MNKVTNRHHHYYTVLYVSSLLFVCSCSDSSSTTSQIPFSFVVGGQSFVPVIATGAIDARYDTSFGGLSITVYGYSSFLQMELTPVLDTGMYYFDGRGPGNTVTYWSDNSHIYRTEDTLPGYLHVALFDKNFKRIVGTFGMDIAQVQNKYGGGDGSVLHISSGQFDIHYTKNP